jgi:hypothetical protein
MFTWLAKLYARRIVNVNVNIILAGVLALPIVIGVLKVAAVFGLKAEHKALTGIITFLADVVADVLIYYGLHWLANHSRWRRNLIEDVARAADNIHFIKDASIVQAERAVLSPILYAIWIGTQAYMTTHGYNLAVATATGFLFAVGFTRTLHTIWMLAKDRRKAQAAAAAAALVPPAPAAPQPTSQAAPAPTRHPEPEPVTKS